MKRLYLLLAAVFAILMLLPLFLDNYALGIFVMIFFWAYVGQSWNVLTGYTGHISLGHALYMGIGAYTSTYLAITYGLTPWVGMLIGGVGFVFMLLNALGGWKPKQLALHGAIALVTVGGMWALFTFGLHVLLPPGEILGRF